ncbi:MAG: acyl-CoA dehydrogenase [Tardiphaga sp.]|uniref:acyl-CoA dehydrogenase family protein n=1 Tax=Tardiphaga sp. TaxID=1926292 RepID=UPI0026221681|nr:acyl-CoA dehydrogenase family protein [Tardiphaga sp.]MDB5502871.1 acyl-CoA dehydrogenase [Tardiphaga sp.]
MEFLTPERATCNEFIPGLDRSLQAIPFMELESPRSEAIRLFREAGGPGLLIPRQYAGGGATPLQAARIQRAIGSRSPSLAVATTMHQFSVVTFVELARQRSGPETFLLEAIARQHLLMASGFAEGRSGTGILDATMQAKRTPAGFVVNGRKKPCSLSRSMDLLTASVMVEPDPAANTDAAFAVLLIPAKSDGIERQPFWKNHILGGAESDEVILTNVTVPEQLAWVTERSGEMDPIQICGFIWFELLITASYLGIASALAERAIAAQRGHHADRSLLGIELDGAMTALEGVACHMMAGQIGADLLGRMLLVRYAAERAIERATDLAVALLGGIAFIQSAEVSYLLAASRGLSFHPPSRGSMSEALAAHLAGEALRLP